jgi:hypothetical protein
MRLTPYKNRELVSVRLLLFFLVFISSYFSFWGKMAGGNRIRPSTGTAGRRSAHSSAVVVCSRTNQNSPPFNTSGGRGKTIAARSFSFVASSSLISDSFRIFYLLKSSIIGAAL